MNTADQFDSEIARYIEKARSLKEQRNSQIPLISRIPSEILAIIFEFLATTDPIKALPSRFYPYSHERSSGDYHPCENVTRVCRKWRMLALGMPSIWGVFYSDCSQQWMDYVIKERLKLTSLISIRTLHKWRSHPCDILALRLDSERFKDLDVAITTRQSMTLMHEALRSKNLPALDILRISVDADVTRGTRGCKSFVWRANASRLQALHLKHILLEVRVPSFPALREFSLDLLSCALSIQPDDLLHALSAMPQLRSFTCIGLLASQDRKPIPTDLQVELPSLEHLAVSHFRWADLIIILNRITSRPLISAGLDLYEYGGVGSPNMQPIWKLLPPCPHAGLWHTVLHKKLLWDDDKFSLILQITSPSQKFCFELATKFEEVKAEQHQHVETGIYFSMPSVSTPDIVALTSRRKPGLSPALKRFALDMAEVEEFHFINLTQLLEVLMPNQHLEGVHPPLGNAVTPATKSKPKRLKPNLQQGSKLSTSPSYLPALLRIVVIQQVDLGPSLNLILDYLGQIFLKRKKRGLPILAMKLGGQIYLNEKQRILVGDGVSVELTFIDEGDCPYYMNTSLKEFLEYLGY